VAEQQYLIFKLVTVVLIRRWHSESTTY